MTPFDPGLHPRADDGTFSKKLTDEASGGMSALTSTYRGPRYRMVGTTDDVVECERCGKTELRATVILELLDGDGNSEGVTYYGSSCAARVLAQRGIQITGRKVLDEARSAQQHREELRLDAVQRLEFYGLPTSGDVPYTLFAAALAKFRASNAAAFRNNPQLDPATEFRKSLATWQSRANGRF